MKKFILFLMAMVTLMWVTHAQAKTLEVQDVSGAPGDLITVAVSLDDAKDLLSADITLQYDNALLNPKEVKKTNLTSNFIIAFNALRGEVSLSIATAQALQNGNGAILEISFQISDSATPGTSTTLSISKATLYNGSYQMMGVAAEDGTITVRPTGPSFSPKEGTLGTLIKIAGSGFTGKSPVVKMGGASCKVLKPWTDTEVQCQVAKALAAGTYDVSLKLSNKDQVTPLGSFAFKNPVIDEIQPGSGPVGSTIRAIGKYFSNKKPLVYLEDPVTLKRKSCKVSGWTMDPVTGASTIDFAIPKTTPGNYNVVLKNSVGEGKKSFTVN